MPKIVTAGSLIGCTQGEVPTPLVVSGGSALADGAPVATIDMIVPGENITPFGVCATLTADADGVSTPCVPAIASPWAPPSEATVVDGVPAVTTNSKCICTVGGEVSVQQTMGNSWDTE